MTTRPFTETQRRQFEEDGFFFLRDLLTPAETAELSRRIDDLMDGRIARPGMFFQRDSGTGDYDGVQWDTTRFSGPSRDYRKIKGFEYDPLFLALFQCATIRSLSEALIGPAVSSMRAMLFNKPARIAGELPFHQDVSAKWPMSASPSLTLWIALDDATVESGCMEFAVGSHKHGRIGDGHLLKAEDEARYAPADRRRMIELEAGDAVVFHCALLHRSGPNKTDNSRRAMTLCLMDANIRHTKSGRTYPVIFGPGALDPAAVATLERIELVES
ncbi:MAG TPA: phytanoyl-CoA dioxygenase family protein [Alphaproteobacteria bacterium]|nr:phytanoyl-CoA dioxygenase family protein [Alphaproteobacteria bacterium]